jgi:hypothetical protein
LPPFISFSTSYLELPPSETHSTSAGLTPSRRSKNDDATHSGLRR